MDTSTENFREMAILNLIGLAKDKEWLETNFKYSIGTKGKSLPCIDYLLEDKSNYPKASSAFNKKTRSYYIDEDDDFLVGHSGGFLINIDYVFINTYKFSVVADFFEKHGVYTVHNEESVEYKKFWARETQRRKKGLTRNCKLYVKDILEYFNPSTTKERKEQLLHPLHITGDHYTYLNYSRIERTANEEERKKLDKEGLFDVEIVEAFPRFWDWDYIGYKVLRFGEVNKHNQCIAKARRKGWSYKNGESSANALNLVPNTTVIHVADIVDYLTEEGALSTMTKVNLDWFENHTYWKRGYLSEDYDKGITLGYKKKSEGNKKYGFKSKLLSKAVGRNTSAAIGKKAKKIKVEEAGKLPTLLEFIGVTTSNMESGKISIGNMDIWGTGGTKGTNWESFEKVYYNPLAYNILPFENIWDDNKRTEVCGYFHPQVFNYEPFIWDGNSLVFDSYIDDLELKESERKLKDNTEYLITCAQRANKPSEAFINTVENLFASPELNIHINDLKTDTSKHFHRDLWYVRDGNQTIIYDKDEAIRQNIFGNGKFHDFIVDVPHTNSTDIHGCVREYYSPYTENGVVPKDLYFIACDPYGVDKNMREVTDKHSLYSFQVYMRTNTLAPYTGKRLVAEYTGRLNTMKDNDNLLWAACLRWNCGVLVETNRGETISNFKTWGIANKLLFDPRDYLVNTMSTNPSNKKVGMTVGDGDTKLDGLTMIKNFIYEITGCSINSEDIIRLNEIMSLPLCLELQRYTSTGNFDRISTMILAMYEFKKDEFVKRANLHKSKQSTERKTLYSKLTKS